MSAKIWAHRGASYDFPENSMIAFEQAVIQQADGIELDVQQTKDGVLVIYHDEHLGRLTGKNALLKDLTWAELQTLNICQTSSNHADQVCRIPKFSDFLSWFATQNIELNIEIKNGAYPIPGVEKRLLQEIENLHLENRIIFSSFNHLSMKEIKELNPEVRCGLLYLAQLYRPWEYANSLGVDALHPMKASLLYPDFVNICHDSGLAVHPWTIDDEAELKLAFSLNPDAVITNRPAFARKLR